MSTPSRRQLLQASVVASAFSAATLAGRRAAEAAAATPIRIGLVGCGHRGRGAVENALASSPNVKLVALADAFPEKIEKAHKVFGDASFAGKADLAPERSFSGLDSFQKLLATDVNYVILASPPGFRPFHIQAAVATGKHIFAEKPIAVDSTGIRTCLALVDEVKTKRLGFVAGTHKRHDAGVIETVKRLRAGAIGEIVAARTYWNQGSQWVKPREAGWSDVEWQIRNWFYFTWLSGDQICEQQIHNLDVINWVIGAPPVAAVAVGGRQQRVEPVYGQVYDHMAVDYEYPKDVHVSLMGRQIPNCHNDVSDAFVGTKGKAAFGRGKSNTIDAGARHWESAPVAVNPYVQEHADLIASIRAGAPVNELQRTAESNLTAIMGRLAAYTGRRVTWQQALESKESLLPANLKLGPLPVAGVPVPGKTPLI